MRAFTIFVAALLLLVPKASHAGESLEDMARAALVTFTQAVIAGPQAVEQVLAPEYQIMRANGVGYDRDDYIRHGVAKIVAKPDFLHDDIVATASGDVMVVRYTLQIDETIDGLPVTRRAPRLTVFRRLDGEWKVVAHANFGATTPGK